MIRLFVGLCFGVAASACVPDQGRFTVNFVWEVDPPPPDAFIIEGEVRAPDGRVTPSTPQSVLYSGEVVLRFESVPVGDGLVVEVRLRPADNPTAAPRYFGRSAPFSFDAGDDVTVDVAIQLTDAPVLEEGSPRVVNAIMDRVATSTLTVEIDARAADGFEIAQDADFTLGFVAFPNPVAVATNGAVMTYRLAYDLNGTRPDCESNDCDGDRQIFVRGLGAGLRGSPRSRVIRLDTTPPAGVRGSVRYQATAENALGLIGQPTAATGASMPGATRVFVNITFSEAIRSTPTLRAISGNDVIDFEPVSVPEDGLSTFEFSALIDSTVHADGDYDAQVRMRDLAGNLTDFAAVPGTTIVVDSTPDALRVEQDLVSFIRSPIGNASPETLPSGFVVPAGPFFALGPPDGLDDANDLPADVFAFETGAALAGIQVWADDQRASLLKTVAPQGNSGRWLREDLRLINSDVPAVWVTGIDAAGNLSAPVAIQNSWWVGSSGLLTNGTSPHALGTTPSPQAPLRTVAAATNPQAAAGRDNTSVVEAAEYVWSGRSDTDSPEPRRSIAATYNSAEGTIVLFGGEVFGEGINDTWTYDGVSWVERTPPSILDSAPARVRPGIAFDSERQRVVMFGGGGPQGGTLGDAWEWNGQRWRNITPAGADVPVGRFSPELAYDSARGLTILFGGSNSLFQPLGDTWAYDGESWRDVTPAAANRSPPPRSGHAMAFDSRRGVIVLFGGQTQGGRQNDTWEWNGTQWTNVTPPGTSPSPRNVAQMVYDSNRDVMVLYGGSAPSSLSDVWEWDGAAWTQALPSGAGPAADPFNEQLVYDSVRGRTLLLNQNLEIWAYDGNGWQDVSALSLYRNDNPPSQEEVQQMAYDTLRRRMVLVDSDSSSAVYERIGTRWTRIAVSVGPLFQSSTVDLAPFTLVYDPTRRRTVAVGRRSTATRTWEWSGTTWSDRTLGTTPVARTGHTTAYDVAQRRLILFGGSSALSNDTFADTWEWNGSTRSWQLGGSGPGARRAHAMAYDAVRDRTILFGGQDADARTWAYDGSRWADVTPPRQSPDVRQGHTMAYHSDRGTILMFGGRELSFGSGRFNDLWEWTGTSWRDATPSELGPAPAQRFGHAWAYDSTRRKMVLYGGEASVGPAVSRPRDTWELDAPTQSAVQMAFALPIEVQANIDGLRVRAFCGGVYGDTDDTGARLVGWKNGRQVGAPPGAWVELNEHTTGLALSDQNDGRLRYPADGSSTTADEAASFVLNDQMYFQCRPGGDSGTGLATVSLDYLEVRVKYRTN